MLFEKIKCNILCLRHLFYAFLRFWSQCWNCENLWCVATISNESCCWYSRALAAEPFQFPSQLSIPQSHCVPGIYARTTWNCMLFFSGHVLFYIMNLPQVGIWRSDFRCLWTWEGIQVVLRRIFATLIERTGKTKWNCLYLKLFPQVDLIAELEALRSQQFLNDIAFHEAVSLVFAGIQDTHTRYRPPQCYRDVDYYQPFNLVG